MKQILYRLFEHQYLGREEARTILENIAGGKYNDSQIASLITVFLMRSISVEELTGFREALLEMRVPVNLSEFQPIDIVGTGGDGKNTFNISTTSCFVVAGAGYHVVKHGNYGATSVSGASNVMEQHGVKFTNDESKLRRSIEQCGIAYLHAPFFNPALKAVAPVRKALAVRSFFNMLGPLVNPVIPAYQLLGVYNLPLLRLYNYTYQESGTKFAIVHSLDGYDEISLTDEFKVAMADKEKIYTPEMLGFQRCTEQDLDGGNTPEQAARIFDAVLNNTATEAQKNCVIANSAFAIQVIHPEKKIEECIAEARESLESGRALATFQKFLTLNA
ncbi:MAG: anthranilate phosphoribosyltransferase [Parabacteroides sp.]